VLLKETVLAYGPTPQIFTQANLERTFGGALRQLDFDGRTGRPRPVGVITYDERPFVLYGDKKPGEREAGGGGAT
jgi:manganese/iron transport system ATP-binding protein